MHFTISIKIVFNAMPSNVFSMAGALVPTTPNIYKNREYKRREKPNGGTKKAGRKNYKYSASVTSDIEC